MGYANDLDNIVTLTRVYMLVNLTEDQRAQIKHHIIESIKEYDESYNIHFDLMAATNEILSQLK